MTLEIALLFLIILLFVVLLATEKLQPDALSVILMVTLIVFGFVSPTEGISGFSNQATVTILALMILTVGLETSGVITSMGRWIKKMLKGPEWVIILLIMLTAGTASAFMATTAVVIVFMRILIKLSHSIPTNLSRILMPLSFAGIMGGSCTLIGTSTNLLVSSIAVDSGLPEFNVFEFSVVGIIFFVTGILYMVTIGRKSIPERSPDHLNLASEYDIGSYFTEAVIIKGSKLIGQRIDTSPFLEEKEIDLIEIKPAGLEGRFPNDVDTFQEGDQLLLKGSLETIALLRSENNVRLVPDQEEMIEDRLNTENMILCEVIVRPSSRLVGRPVDKVAIRREYGAIPLAIRKNRKYYGTNLDELIIEAGDTVLMEVAKAAFKRFYNLPEFVVLQEHEELALKTNKRYLASIIMVLVILAAATGITSILVSSLAGCVAMFLTGCLDLQKAYRRIDWSVIFLLAGVIPLGLATDNSGASKWIADSFVSGLGHVSPRVIVAALFGFAMFLSAVISNNATAVLVAPIAISIATNLQMDPRPLLFTVMFGSNMSFMTPIGYQTNALIYGAGNFRFSDFAKVGGVLSLIIWILAIIFIPLFYY